MGAAPKVKGTTKFEIEVIRGPHAGLKLASDKTSVTLGRGPENDVVLTNDPRVSRQHAEIKQRGSDFVIVNLSQKNFILVNGNNVQSEIITNESVILIGDCELRLKAKNPPSPLADLSKAGPSALVSLAPESGVPASPLAKPPRPQMPPTPQAVAPVPPQPMAPPPYGSGARTQGPSVAPRASSGSLLSNPRARFYGIIAILGLVFWFLLSPSNKDNEDRNAFRTSELAIADVLEAEKNAKELLVMKKEKFDTIQYRRAQENFVRGFRDYQQGQYARAREAFQVVLNLDPENELAKRYFHLSKIKFDEMVKFNMIQGNRYREKKNWRMCQANYSIVMTMLQNRRDDPTYKEAKQFFEQCSLNGEGRF